MSARLERLKRYWEELTPEAVGRLAEVYAEDASFRDPFNEVRGVEAIGHVFAKMYATLHEPRFAIVETLEEGEGALLVWDFTFRIKAWRPAVTRTIRGASHVRFAPDGRVAYHRDYWDAAGELYAQLPVVGGLMRWLARRMG